MSEPLRVGRYMSNVFGVAFASRYGQDGEGPYVDLSPQPSPEAETFRIRLRQGLTSVEASFVAGSFSGPLLSAMGDAEEAAKETFCSVSAAAASRGATISMLVNGQRVEPCDWRSWPARWRQLEIALKRFGVVEGGGLDEPALSTWGSYLVAMVLSLVPVGADIGSASATSTVQEGAVTRVEVNRYERSPAYRAICIATRGTTCHVCGLSFGETYGPLAAGYIHVHHLIPVSHMTPGPPFDPLTDLVPVCPNCHGVIHLQDPPLSVEQVRDMVHGTAPNG